MALELVAQYLNAAVAAALLIRLVALGLATRYKTITAFILYDLVVEVIFLCANWQKYHIDYRVAWISERPLVWFFYIAVAYSILSKLLEEHGGILSISKKVLVGCFALAVLIGLASAQLEYSLASQAETNSWVL